MTKESIADSLSLNKAVHVSFIGCAGVPNCYGGFEAFVENCGPMIASYVDSVTVTCDASLYSDKSRFFSGLRRKFIPVRANGNASILHDLLAFFSVFRRSTHIIVLGISGGIWFPFFRFLCDISGKRLLVNIDGIEWRRKKFTGVKLVLLRMFDWLAQQCAHIVIYDNLALQPYVISRVLSKAIQIGYSGDHVIRIDGAKKKSSVALTICRIEPENNLEILIEGVLRSNLSCYTIVGNWSNSAYGQALRKRYSLEERIVLLDPIYNPQELAELRDTCEVYLHGHSVGGTNPSLVEMLFYDCHIICFDVPFNRSTAGLCAFYFKDSDMLANILNESIKESSQLEERYHRRVIFTRKSIVLKYMNALTMGN